MVIALSFGVVHVVLSWGYIGTFWLDSGRWLHEVDRFSRGEVLYRDFVWPFPPLALWILGGIARLFGSDLSVIWTVTSIVFMLLVLLYVLYVRELVEPTVQWLALVAGLLLATAHANWGSSPLPTGMYTPAAPIGFLFLFAALILHWSTLASLDSEALRRLSAGGVGLLCALAFLTKQDFWIPALWLTAWASHERGSLPRSGRLIQAAVGWGTFFATTSAGVAVVVMTSGWRRLWDIAGGFGRIAEFSGRHYPSWERITIQLAGAALVGLAGLVVLVWGGSLTLREARRGLGLLGSVFLGGCLLHAVMSFRIASDAVGGASVPPSDTLMFMRGYTTSTLRMLFGALVWLQVRLENSLFPALIPAVALAGLFACRGAARRVEGWRPLAFLAVFCLAARLRRGFEHVEWFHLLLELPMCLSCASWILKAKGREVRSSLRAALSCLLVLGLYYHARWGQDSFLRRDQYRCVDTPRGTACLEPRQAEQYGLLREALDRLDPSRKRPLLAFGYSGGFNYFLDRPNPTPLEEGFQFSGFPPDQVLADLRSSSPAPVLLDTDYYENIRMPASSLNLAHWELATYLNVHTRVDRLRFEKALEVCPLSWRIQTATGPWFALHDCPRPQS